MVKVFLTGASGYIGGQVLHELASSAKYSITALVRGSEKCEVVGQKYPKVKVVSGDLDDTETIKREASSADIVLHLAHNKHIRSIKAIHEALSHRTPSKPAYWIQVSGASVLAAAEIASPSFSPGSPSSATFDDLEGASKLRDLIRAYPARATDNYILDVAGNNHGIKTAIVFPPIIYGQGQGPVNQRSIQIPTLCKVTLDRGAAVQVGKGENRWGNVHIRDLGKLISRLAEEASNDGAAKPELWSDQGLYLTSVGETSFADVSQKIASAAVQQGLIKTKTVEELVGTEADKVLPAGSIMYGTNARSKAQRAKELLGWTPKEDSLDAEIPRAVAEAAKLR
ncbi:hypothetical protein F4810DRAFT_722224 [Camillea tinctor]|nr:hypothetical protein F4810DRAFT_722224 [Camillea tinctor]